LWRSRPETGGTAGFTLLEALVALAVTGAGLAAIGALANSSLHASLYTERHLAEIESAQGSCRDAGTRRASVRPSDGLARRPSMTHRFRAHVGYRRNKRPNVMDPAEHRPAGAVPVRRDD
jgi:hypothetical protein